MLSVILAVFGGLVGSLLFRDFTGFIPGAIVGALAGAVADLGSRVSKLERLLETARRGAEPRAATAGAQLAPAAAKTTPASAPPAPTAGSVSPELAAPLPPAAPRPPEPAPALAAAVPASPAPATTRVKAAPPRAPQRRPQVPREPSALDALFANVLRWFTTGNVPVKVGVVLSLFGVAFLVKEGIDREWLVLPIEMRLVLVALFGIGLLALGWRLRTRQRAYALSVQGGGIGVLYVTIYASFAIYGLLPAPLAFGLLVAVTAAAGALAVLQDAHALAVLGILGGFLAPVLASTDSGNHVALFGYYAVLDLAIFAIAWFKAWRALNVLGFVFTFVIGTLWGVDAYEPELFETTEPFLVLFTLLYLAIPVLFAMRVEPPKLRGFVDGTLVFGTPLVAFALQSQLVADTEYGLAISAVALALLYFGLSAYLRRTQRDELAVLAEAELALGVAFSTIAVPLALDARWTSAAWALQGAALVWLACRQQRKLALLAGLVLQLASGLTYVAQSAAPIAWPVVNGEFLGGLVVAFAGFFSARLLDPAREQSTERAPVRDSFARLLSIALFVWAAAWWYVGGLDELDRVLVTAELAASLGFVAATGVLAVLVGARLRWLRLDWLGLVTWPAAALLAMAIVEELAHPAAEFGWLAWPAVLASMAWFLRKREAQFPGLASALHATLYWLAVALALLETHWLMARIAVGAWPAAAVLAVGAVAVLATLRATGAVARPFAAHSRAYLEAGSGAVLAVLLALAGVLTFTPADAAPLPYAPLANPLELATVLLVYALLEWLAALGRHSAAFAGAAAARPAVAAGFAWVLVTTMVARAVHHFAGVPYDVESLAESTAFQSSLSIVWGIAGLAAMVVGARALRRAVWLAGAVLMGVVVVKLFLVDLGNTDTLARVVSFLGVGVLLLVVGYFAPVPPRAEAAARPA